MRRESMEKTDLKKTQKVAFTGKKDPQIVTIPALKYLSFAGKGSPDAPLFEEAIGALYGLAYTIKFMFKERELDFVVAPLEAQWWSDDLNDFTENRKENWLWKAMICVPDFVMPSDLEEGREKVRAKKSLSGLDQVVLETIEDGEAVQVLYLGAYSEEAPTIAMMHHFAEEEGYRLRSHHREVYLSDMRKTPPDKLKTIIRHPVERVK
jgi:hypothetical protein